MEHNKERLFEAIFGAFLFMSFIGMGFIACNSMVKDMRKAEIEQEKLNQYFIDHCKVIAVENPVLSPPLRREGKGHNIIMNGKQVAYSCDNGMIYWRTR